MENNGEGAEGERVEEAGVGENGEGEDLTNGNQHGSGAVGSAGENAGTPGDPFASAAAAALS